MRRQRKLNPNSHWQCRSSGRAVAKKWGPVSATKRALGRYKEGGPAAEARFEGGMAGFEARTFRGCGVFTSEPFEVSDGAPPRRTARRGEGHLGVGWAGVALTPHSCASQTRTRSRC